MVDDGWILWDRAVIKILNPKVIDNSKKVSQTEQWKIYSISLRTNYILNSSVNSKNKEGLNQEINWNKENNIDRKLPIHKSGELRVMGNEWWVSL